MNINKYAELRVTKTYRGYCEVEIERQEVNAWHDRIYKRVSTYSSITLASAMRLNEILAQDKWVFYTVEYPENPDSDGTPNFSTTTVYRYIMNGYQDDAKILVTASKTPFAKTIIKTLEKPLGE